MSNSIDTTSNTAAPQSTNGSCHSGAGCGCEKSEQVPTAVTLALILAFFLPLAGLIMAYVSRAEAKHTGPISTKQNKIALIVSWVQVGLGAILTVIFFFYFLLSITKFVNLMGPLAMLSM